MSSNAELKIGDKTRIAEVGDWDYSWSLYAVFADEAGRLFSTTDGGCSCSGPYEYESEMDWTPLESIQHAIREARKWSGATAKDIEDFVSDLMAYRPRGTR